MIDATIQLIPRFRSGLAAVAFAALDQSIAGDSVNSVRSIWKGARGAFVLGCIVFMWGANLIIPIRPKR